MLFLSTLWSGLTRFSVHLIGRWQWQPPGWIAALRRYLEAPWRYAAAEPKRAALVLLGVLSLLGGYVWYKHRPMPEFVPYTATAPPLTTYDDHGIASIQPLKVDFSGSAALLRLVEKRVTTGVDIAPTIAGTWFWVSDRQLQFTPKSDWPIDAAFTVRFARKGLFAQDVKLEDYSFQFKTQPFYARVDQSLFYQDPSDPNLKKLVATVKFTHPVDTEQFAKRVSLNLSFDAAYLGLKPDSRQFTVAYDKFKLAAYIHSVPLTMPRDDTAMTLRIEKGVRAARGGNETASRLESVVVIPGRSSLRFSGANMTLVDNARYEPEQVLLLTSSSPVPEKAFAGKVSLYLLPVRNPKQAKEEKEPYQWDDTKIIGVDILAKSERLGVSYVSSDEGSATLHGFKFHATVARYVYLAVAEGVEGTGGYISGKPFVAAIKVAPYPQALTFLGQGALLSLSGDKKVGFLARDVDRVAVEIGRVLPNQLQHLVPAMWDYAHPQVYEDAENTLLERFTSVRDFSGKQPGKPIYDSVDLGQYFQGATNRGLYLLRIRSVPPKKAPEEANGQAAAGDEESEGGIEDKRLILITDLGFIVKQAKNGARDVFVQSIHSGLPVEGARVEVAGRNGQVVLAATTDSGGRAQLPKFGELKREKVPLMLVVQKDSDFSFLPLATQQRQLDFSRFDTGGVENASSPQQLSSYLFSDRGIYRPGEAAHIALVTRTADWKSSLAGLPLDVEISDSRGAVVSRNTLKVSAAGFDEIAYTSPASAPTGTYIASAYLVKEKKDPEMLGSTTFRVQEFEPDRMKVRLELSEQPAEGWLRPGDVKARVTVAHLFGDAASNRRVEGEMNLTAILPRFGRYADYRFQTGEGLKEPVQETLAATVTDDTGNAELKLDLNRFAGRAYRLNVLARAFEAEGGRNVAAENSTIVSDAAFLVGVKPDGDLGFVQRASARQANWLAVNQHLATVAAEGLTLEWVQRKYVSVLTQQDNGTYKYVSRLKEIVRNSRKVQIAASGSNFALPTQEPGDFALVLRDAAGAELNQLSYSVAGQANLSRSLERNAELQIQLDKPAYKGGDTIAVSIRAPYTGAGLITIERDRVFHHRWFKTSTTSTVQTIQLPSDFEGNGYVSVQFLRDPSSDELFLSPLSYGVAPFSANLDARTQTLSLVAPRELKPGAILTMRVKPGEASRVAVLAVDEGILQVARYKNPNPLGYLFQKRSLEVDTSQILDLILPEFKRFLALAAPGGDEDSSFARHLNPFNKKRKAPVAYWSGLMDVGPAGRELHYTVPDYFNGKLRVVAIAVSPRRVGVTEVATEVKGSFILTPNVPAMVAPGDDFTVSVGVFNNTIRGEGPIHLEVQSGAGLSPQTAVNMDLQVPDKKEGTAAFRFKANDLLGAASLKFVASRGNGTTRAESRVEESISVRPAIAYRTQLTLGRFDGSSKEAPLTRDLYSEHRKVEAAASFLPLVWADGLIAYLDDYPYPCTEQLVSKGVAALILASRPEFGGVRSSDPQPLASAYSMLQGRQNDQGGFGLWSSSPETAEFATIYAVHFLVEAKDRGQKLPPDVLSAADEWLTKFAASPASSLTDGRQRAYAVYLLARQGIKPSAALANVEQELSNRYPKTWQGDLAAAYLAATYRLMQRNDDAERIFKNVPWSAQKREWEGEIYYDTSVHDAQLLYLLAKHFPGRLNSVPAAALEGLADAVNDNKLNSLSAAYMLLALDSYAKAAGTQGKLSISAVAKDGNEQALTLPAGAMPKVNVPGNAAKVRFTKEGRVAVYYALNESGFDRNPPTVEMNHGVEIVREYLDIKGNPVTQVKVGEEFLVRLRLRATQGERQPQIAVVDLLPGGVEAVLELHPPADTSAAGVDPAQTGYSAMPIGLPDKSDWNLLQHVDVRDDRVVLYGDITKDAAAFVYRVRATNAGVFQTPPAFAEGMYDRKISGISLPGKLEIVKP